jgi:hypothetical protein
MKPPKPTVKKLIPKPNSNKMNKALEKPKVMKIKLEKMKQNNSSVKNPNTAVKKTSRPVTGPVKKTSRPVTITGSVTGTKSLTAAQVAKFNKLTSNINKMGNR